MKDQNPKIPKKKRQTTQLFVDKVNIKITETWMKVGTLCKVKQARHRTLRFSLINHNQDTDHTDVAGRIAVTRGQERYWEERNREGLINCTKTIKQTKFLCYIA